MMKEDGRTKNPPYKSKNNKRKTTNEYCKILANHSTESCEAAPQPQLLRIYGTFVNFTTVTIIEKKKIGIKILRG